MRAFMKINVFKNATVVNINNPNPKFKLRIRILFESKNMDGFGLPYLLLPVYYNFYKASRQRVECIEDILFSFTLWDVANKDSCVWNADVHLYKNKKYCANAPPPHTYICCCCCIGFSILMYRDNITTIGSEEMLWY